MFVTVIASVMFALIALMGVSVFSALVLARKTDRMTLDYREE